MGMFSFNCIVCNKPLVSARIIIEKKLSKKLCQGIALTSKGKIEGLYDGYGRLNKIDIMTENYPYSPEVYHKECFESLIHKPEKQTRGSIRSECQGFMFERIGFSSFAIGNNKSSLRRIANVIRELEKEQGRKETKISEEKYKFYQTVEGEVIYEETNVINLFFLGKPSQEIRNLLEQNGFEWSNKTGSWIRSLDDEGKKAALYLLNILIKGVINESE